MSYVLIVGKGDCLITQETKDDGTVGIGFYPGWVGRDVDITKLEPELILASTTIESFEVVKKAIDLAIEKMKKPEKEGE